MERSAIRGIIRFISLDSILFHALRLLCYIDDSNFELVKSEE